MHTAICKGCGVTFLHQKADRKYCRFNCRAKLNEWTQSQIRFHIWRAGSRKAFESYLGITSRILYQCFQIQAVDKLRNNQMISIGGILVKRCPGCYVTWPLEKYWSQEQNVSGVQGRCESCRSEKNTANIHVVRASAYIRDGGT